MIPKSESFWLAVGLICLFHLVTAAVIIALLVIPWRSNFMVFQLDEKAKPVPAIQMPETPTMKPIHEWQNITPTAPPVIDFNAPAKRPM